MRVKEYLYGNREIDLKVQVYIVDEVNGEEIEMNTYKVRSDFTYYELKGNTKELEKIFNYVIHQLEKQFGIKRIESETLAYSSILYGDFTQDTPHGLNYFKLKLKVSNN